MKRVLLVLLFCSMMVLSSCKNGNQKKADDSNDETQLSGDVSPRVGNGSFVYAKGINTVFTDGFTIYSQGTGNGETQIRLFDASSRTDIPYCFRPECEHNPPSYDDDGQIVGEVCPSYAFPGDTVLLQGDYLYSFGFPYLYRFDRRGENEKIICEVDMPQPIIWQVLYSKTDAYVLYYYFTEYEQTTDSGGNIIWLPGEPRDDRITGILHVSLVDGSYEDITPESDCKYRDVLNFRVEDDGLFFYYCDTDEDELVTNDMKTDSERYSWRAEHQWHTVYYYNAKTKDTSIILSKKGTWDYSFGDGFIIEKEGRIGTDRRIVFLNLDGTMIRELEKDKRFVTSVNSDKDLIYAYSASEAGRHVYCLCNLMTDEVERQVTVPYTFMVYAATGDSYYGLDSDSPYGFGIGILFWISKEDFWEGRLDQAEYLLSVQQ
ncbi:MAG: hypothetical protein IKI01_02260 [Lachnospiraceae bacterium]|nr:hypothetical protein [Lachnospiraceae bacterium]